MNKYKYKHKYFAHTANQDGDWHVLAKHLRDVGRLTAKFAHNFLAAASVDTKEIDNFAKVCHWSGLLHDIGKYRDEFQEYLRGDRDSSIDTHHAVYGAAIAFQRGWLGPAFVIAGHHAGLHDLDQLQQLVTDKRYHLNEHLPQIITQFEYELEKITTSINEPSFIENDICSLDFYIRMLFSALIDADFLDTNKHCQSKTRDTLTLNAPLLLQQLLDEKAKKPTKGKLNAIRNSILQNCLDAANKTCGFFSLTVPTGGGKTLSSMAFALAHAAKYNKQRIIVVIPYLSIIEQNSAQYRRILDPDNMGIVIEHHSAVEYPIDNDETRSRSPFIKHPLEYATENWDAPIIVTTSVQFIESLFANRTSRCRKLHNIAQSVVIFDEVQTLPTHLLNPLLNVLHELRNHYGVSFLFSTATQPAFCYMPLTLEDGFKQDELQEITHDIDTIFSTLKRVSITIPQADEYISWDQLAEQIYDKQYHEKNWKQQALCIVNVRKHAFALREQFARILPNTDALFHLSSAMCAQHRFDLLGDDLNPEEGSIRFRLRNKQACILVSTQLIEAGVDVDFPAVWRSMGPLDSIIQAAGRCNRENILCTADGKPVLGEVTLFRPIEHTLPPGLYRSASNITEAILTNLDSTQLAINHSLFASYFQQLHQLVATDKTVQDERKKLHFRTVAELARVIHNDSQAIIVPYGKGITIIEHLRSRKLLAGQLRFDRHDLRQLQRYIVNLHQRDYQRLLNINALQPLLPNIDLHVLDDGYYHDELGIVIEQCPLEDFLI